MEEVKLSSSRDRRPLSETVKQYEETPQNKIKCFEISPQASLIAVNVGHSLVIRALN